MVDRWWNLKVDSLNLTPPPMVPDTATIKEALNFLAQESSDQVPIVDSAGLALLYMQSCRVDFAPIRICNIHLEIAISDSLYACKLQRHQIYLNSIIFQALSANTFFSLKLKMYTKINIYFLLVIKPVRGL